jgi:hypothetical protein
VEFFNRTKPISRAEALQALEAEWGEPVLYCAMGQFLNAQGLDGLPLALWGLVVLTPSRLMFKRYSQTHPLFGMKDNEVNWSVNRDQFASCQAHKMGFWRRIAFNSNDHVSLEGPGTKLMVELTDDPRTLAGIWASGQADPLTPTASKS